MKRIHSLESAIPASIIVSAVRDTKQSNLAAYACVKIFGKRELQVVAFLLYAYFRWLDDVVDDMTLDSGQKTSILLRQYDLAKDLFATKRINRQLCLVHSGPVGESYLQILSRISINLNTEMRTDILAMLDALRFDLERQGWHLRTRQELQGAAETEVRSFMNIVRFVCGDFGEYPRDQVYSAGQGCKMIHMLRDFGRDYEVGYVNISVEDLERYSLARGSLTFMDHERLHPWMKEQAERASQLVRVGKSSVLVSPSLRYKLAVFAYCAKYECILRDLDAKSIQSSPRRMVLFLNRLIGILRILSDLAFVLFDHVLHCRSRSTIDKKVSIP